MKIWINKRKHQRVPLHQNSRCGFLHNTELLYTPRMTERPIISNLGFGGMKINFIPGIGPSIFNSLIEGKSNLYLVFFLTPTRKILTITAKARWGEKKTFPEGSLTTLGVEFLLKTQDLFREIDSFLRLSSLDSAFDKEKRGFPRVPVEHPLQFAIEGVKHLYFFQKQFSGKIANLSAKGLLLEMNSPFKPEVITQLRNESSTISAEFLIPSLGETFSVATRPVHLDPITSKLPVNRLGLKFLNLSEPKQGLLSEYLMAKKYTFLRGEVPTQKAKNN